MYDTKVMLSLGEWQLLQVYNPDNNITVLRIKNGCDDISISFEQNHALGGFKDNKCIFNKIDIRVSSYSFCSIEGAEEYIEQQKEALEFARKAIAYAKDNGFWID